MRGKQASVCTGCWRPVLLSCVLVLHLVPPAVHGNVGGINATEPESTVNITSLLVEEEGPLKVNEGVATVTGISHSATSNPISTVTPRAGRMPRAGEDDDQSSGMFGESVVPTVEKVSVPVPPQLSPDSAETEHLLPSNPHRDETAAEEEKEEKDGRSPHTDPPWIQAKDTAVFDLDQIFTTTAPPSTATNPPNPDVLHVDFFDPSSRGRNLDLAPPSPSLRAHELQGNDATSWVMQENYDYLTPYEDTVSPTSEDYTYSTTTDAYEISEDPRGAAGSPSRSKTRFSGSGSFIPGASFPNVGAPKGPVGASSSGGCLLGYQLVNGSCRSACDMQPNYCFNGGQCYQLNGDEMFCRCNVQDYIWHKGSRCESVVTEFQVICLVVGASALVVLLLFMIIVCFAKKLHVLKTENKKLRKRSSKYRPSSEQHNDNFSLSTIAEGSHPNKTMSRYTWECKTKEESDCEDDPNSQNKLEDPMKAPAKEDDSLNIHNSLTPKQENHKVLGEENSSEVNSLQNNMM
ncbi:chondroitin sulfate proteoglycan 5 isoform X3 [Oryzias melastigma]|uniref:chondroitin sulfate proteoglycan 5 isoform X3 n=1 Tax=Oryzias melastigma TaxID=30732 RepID=UPI000CF7CEBF|nr:chondroitin sulfate proteoglycan 5 isoform X3 [Oryzias melastigma]